MITKFQATAGARAEAMSFRVARFQAAYRVTVYSNDDTAIVEYPITCKFNVSRQTFSDSNKATIELYNLSPSTRSKLQHDIFTLDPMKQKYVHLEAGYGNKENMSLIFKGRVLQAYSSKSGGQVDIITRIEAAALDIFDCQASFTFEAGTTFKEAYKQIASTMPNVNIANIGALEGTFKTPTTFDGNVLDELNKLTGGHAFVDNGELNCIFDNEVIEVPVPIISNDTSLLETPIRRDAQLEVKMLFEPTLIVGQLLEIESSVFPDYNGQYKVVGFTHDCLISSAQAGQRTTTANLLIADLLPNSDITITGGAAGIGLTEVKAEERKPVNAGVNVKWIWPCKGKIRGYYGEKRPTHVHNGLDIAVPIGTPIKAVADGKVVRSGKMTGYGIGIVIQHNVNGKIVTSEYGHLSQRYAQYGQQVKQGQIIAKLGNTGDGGKAHLHITIREGAYQGTAVNPYKYLPRNQN